MMMMVMMMMVMMVIMMMMMVMMMMIMIMIMMVMMMMMVVIVMMMMMMMIVMMMMMTRMVMMIMMCIICGPHAIPGVYTTCGSNLLVVILTPWVFTSFTPRQNKLPNFNLTRKQCPQVVTQGTCALHNVPMQVTNWVSYKIQNYCNKVTSLY